MIQDFLKELEEAEMVLIGLGEEFDTTKLLKNQEGYIVGKKGIEEAGEHWLLPVYDECYRKLIASKECYHNADEEIKLALKQLAELIKNKNYFVVTTSVNDRIMDISWKEKRLVAPCGGSRKKQCPRGCRSALKELLPEEKEVMVRWGMNLAEEMMKQSDEAESKVMQNAPLQALGVCPECGKPLVLNSIYVEQYDENGYMEQWQHYTKWLQGTLNRKLLILELGVGMKFPSVIRWPFEKTAYFNKKAHIYRVNETLYQLTEEIKEKGTSIQKNSVDWLLSLC